MFGELHQKGRRCGVVQGVDQSAQGPTVQQEHYELQMTSKKQRNKFFIKYGLNWDRWHLRRFLARNFEKHYGPENLQRFFRQSDLAILLNEPPQQPECRSVRPDLVMTIGDYMDNMIWYRFVRSLRESGFLGDVIIFTNNNSTQLDHVLKRYRVMRKAYSVAEDTVPGGWADVRVTRFRTYLRFLLEHGTRYHRVGLFDSRDVVFQRDPFSGSACAGLTAYGETAAISLLEKRHVYFSKRWPEKSVYRCDNNEDALAANSRLPLNSGVIIADVPAMVLFLQLFHCEIVSCGGWDQAVFTRLVYMDLTKMMNVTIFATESGPVANLCASLTVKMSPSHEVINDAHYPYSVLHQYDRFESLTRRVKLLYPQLMHVERL